MTLAQWSKLTGVLPTHPTAERGAVSLAVSESDPHYRQLWTLEDFRVSSCYRGVVFWLVPRQAESR
jgi:hypothetical protein